MIAYQLPALLLLLVLYILLLVRLRHRVATFRNYILLPVTALLGFGLYFGGYLATGENSVAMNIIMAIFSTVEMIVMKMDLGGIAQPCRDNVLYMTLFTLTHAMAIVLVTTTVLSIWGKRFTTKLLLRIYRHKRSYIFFDTNEEAMTLATDLLHNDSKRVVIFVSDDEAQIKEIERMGAYHINPVRSRNKMGGTSLFANIISSNSELFYLSDDEALNMNRVLQMLAQLRTLSPEKLRVAEESIDLHIRIDTEDMQQVFDDARKLQRVNLNYSMFNEAEIIATQLIRDYPPVKYINPNPQTAAATSDYEVMFLGFGKRGRAMLRKTIEFGQFVSSTYRATVVDVAIRSKMGSFNANYPALSENYTIEPIEDSASSDSFFALLKERSTTLKQIVISLPTDAQNMMRAIEIHKILSSLGRTDIDIIVVTRSADGYGYMDTSTGFASIHCIGRNREIYTESIIVNDAIAAQAVATHSFYNAQKTPENQEKWRTLSSHKQQSNVSVSLHIPTKLALMGLTSDTLSQFATKEAYLTFLRSNQERYDNLARTEHLRWNAFHYVRGWQRWTLNDENKKKSSDEIKKLHICLVEWDDLPPLDIHQSQKVGTYQGYDYLNSDGVWEVEDKSL